MFRSDDRDAAIEIAMKGIGPIVDVLGSKNYLIGAKVSLVDFVLFEGIETVIVLCRDERLFDKHPTLRALRDRMLALPKFGAYYKSDACIKRPFFISTVKVAM